MVKRNIGNFPAYHFKGKEIHLKGTEMKEFLPPITREKKSDKSLCCNCGGRRKCERRELHLLFTTCIRSKQVPLCKDCFAAVKDGDVLRRGCLSWQNKIKPMVIGPQEAALRQACFDAKGNEYENARGILADWLDDHGRSKEAADIRPPSVQC